MDMQRAKAFTYTQATPSAEWQVNHNLGIYPAVDILVDYLGEQHRIIPNQVVYNNPNTCTIWFTTPFTGTAVVS